MYNYKILPKINPYHFKSDDFFKAIEEKCNSLYNTVNDKGKGIIDKIREIVSWDAVGEKDPEKLRGYLQEINNLFKDLNGRSLSGNITGFGDRINEIFEKSIFFSKDISKIYNKKNNI